MSVSIYFEHVVRHRKSLHARMMQVDLLITERKEAQQAAQSDESTKRQKEADNNAYLSLMPLALPAPPVGGTSDFSGKLVCQPLSPHYPTIKLCRPCNEYIGLLLYHVALPHLYCHQRASEGAGCYFGLEWTLLL